MKFELTISGLCVIAMKTSNKQSDPRPRRPDAVDIIVPDAHNHQCRLVWAPEDVTPYIEPELIVDTAGHRLGSLDMKKRNLCLRFPVDADTGFDVHWGPPKQAAPALGGNESLWMNWVPMMEHIGFDPISVPKVGKKSKGTRARLNLPFGRITGSEIVMRPGTDIPLLWRFADNSVRAIANKVLYTVDDFSRLQLEDTKGKTLLLIDGAGDQVIRMCLSNDTTTVPTTFNIGVTELTHLGHLSVLEPTSAKTKGFKAPKLVELERTGDNICTQVVNVYETGT